MYRAVVFLILTVIYGQINLENISGIVLHFIGDSVEYDANTGKITKIKNLADLGNPGIPYGPPYDTPSYVPSLPFFNGHGGIRLGPFFNGEQIIKYNRVWGKTFFIVVKYLGVGSYVPLFGDSLYYHFSGGGNGELLSLQYAHPTFQGSKKCMVGGTFISPYSFIPLIDSVYVVAFRTGSADSAATNLLCSDRFLQGRTIYGYIAEVVIFNRWLPDDTCFLISLYLMNKYGLISGANSISWDTIYKNFPGWVYPNQNIIADNYTWSNGDSGLIAYIQARGVYYLAGYKYHSKTFIDTVILDTFPSIVPSTWICPPDTQKTVGLPFSLSDYSYLWSNGATDSFITGKIGDTFSVVIKKNDLTVLYDSLRVGFGGDTLNIKNYLGADGERCLGDTIFLPGGNVSYVWDNGSIESFYVVNANDTVSITATTSNGCIQADTLIITAVPPPIISVYAPELCEKEIGQFSFTSSAPIVSVTWYFGDGKSSNSLFPSHVYDTAGYLALLLEAYTDIGCRVLVKDTIYVSPLPHVSVSAPSWMCANSSYQLLATSLLPLDSISTYLWTFNNGATYTTSNPVVFFNNPGKWVVTVNVTTNSGCVEQIVKSYSIYDSLACIDILSLPAPYIWVSGDSFSLDQQGFIDTLWNKIPGGPFLYQDESSARPSLISNIPIINNKSAISFDGINDYLIFSENSNIRTVFWVLHEDPNFVSWDPLLGHSTYADFHRGYNKVFFDPNYTSPYVYQGILRQNHLKVSSTQTPLSNNWAILSLVTTGPAKANNFSSDRLLSYRYFKGELAELIILNSPLDSSSVKKVESYLHYKYSPPVNLGPDIYIPYSLCPITLDASNRYVSYYWNTQSTTPTITVNKSGTYSVTVTDIFGWQWVDSIKVIFPGDPFPSSNVFCAGDTFKWDTKLPSNLYSFMWSTGDTTPFLLITQPGTYSLTVTDTTGCKLIIPPQIITVDSFSYKYPKKNDTLVCVDNEICLFDTLNALTFLWSDNQVGRCRIFKTPGIYSVSITNANNCSFNDTFNIGVKGYAPAASFSYSGNCFPGTTYFYGAFSSPSNTPIDTTFFTILSDTLPGNTVSYSFPGPGKYLVKYFVIDTNNCYKIVVDSVQMNMPPISNFAKNSLYCANKMYSFYSSATNGSAPINSYTWIINNYSNTIHDTLYSFYINYSFPAPDTYSIYHLVKDMNGCLDDTSINVVVYPTDIASFTYQPSSLNPCEKDTIKFTSTSSPFLTTYFWEFGDGSNPANGYSTNHVFKSARIYTVTHYVYNSYGCVDDTSQIITVYPKPSAALYISEPVCDSTPSNIIAIVNSQDSISQIIWKLNGITYDTNTTSIMPKLSSGSHIIQLYLTSNKGCTSLLDTTIISYPSPSASFLANPTYGIPPQIIQLSNQSTGATQYLWNFGDGTTSSLISPSHIYSDTGTFQIVLQAINSYNCSDVYTQYVTIQLPNYDIAIIALEGTSPNKISMIVANKSTLPVSYFYVNYHYPLGTFTEKYNIFIPQQTTISLPSISYFSTKDSITNLCIELSNPDNYPDIHPADNIACISFHNLPILLFYEYTQNALTLNFLTNSQLSTPLIIYTPDGKLLKMQSIELFQGLNSIKITNLALSPSLYIICLLNTQSLYKVVIPNY